MAIAGKTHWFGVFLLFVSSILLLITTISAPIINDVGLLRVTLRGNPHYQHQSLSFGTFGYCVLDTPPFHTANTFCTKRHIGYSPAHVIANADGTSISEIAGGTSDGLTRVMVLHPIECGLAFLAFLVSLGAGIVGSFVGAMIAFVAWILVLISLAVDFSIFGILHHHVNDDGSGSHAYFGSGMWCLVASFVTLFFGILIVLFTCCSARREKNRTRSEGEAAPRKKRFGVF